MTSVISSLLGIIFAPLFCGLLFLSPLRADSASDRQFAKEHDPYKDRREGYGDGISAIGRATIKNSNLLIILYRNNMQSVDDKDVGLIVIYKEVDGKLVQTFSQVLDDFLGMRRPELKLRDLDSDGDPEVIIVIDGHANATPYADNFFYRWSNDALLPIGLGDNGEEPIIGDFDADDPMIVDLDNDGKKEVIWNSPSRFRNYDYTTVYRISNSTGKYEEWFEGVCSDKLSPSSPEGLSKACDLTSDDIDPKTEEMVPKPIDTTFPYILHFFNGADGDAKLSGSLFLNGKEITVVTAKDQHLTFCVPVTSSPKIEFKSSSHSGAAWFFLEQVNCIFKDYDLEIHQEDLDYLVPFRMQKADKGDRRDIDANGIIDDRDIAECFKRCKSHYADDHCVMPAPFGSAPTPTPTSTPPPNQVSISLSPSTLSQYENGRGLVTVSTPAPAGGTRVFLHNTNKNVGTAQILEVPEGSRTAMFVVHAFSVTVPSYGFLTAMIDGAVSERIYILVNPPADSAPTPTPILTPNSTSPGPSQ